MFLFHVLLVLYSTGFSRVLSLFIVNSTKSAKSQLLMLNPSIVQAIY